MATRIFVTIDARHREGLPPGLRNILRRAATATLADEIRDDDAATGQGLLNRFERAMNCGAITKEEAVEMTGLTLAELHTKSFAKILANRSSQQRTRSK